MTKPKTQELKIRVFTRPQYTHKIFDIIEELLDIIVLDKTQRYEFIIALGEALDNAITHGNHQDPARFIEINCAIDDTQIACTIADEGSGFDHQKHLANIPKEFDPKAIIHRAAKGKIGGLGFGLIKKCIDEVRFNQRGNQITLIKYLASTK